jgi:hypothetical protein
MSIKKFGSYWSVKYSINHELNQQLNNIFHLNIYMSQKFNTISE